MISEYKNWRRRGGETRAYFVIYNHKFKKHTLIFSKATLSTPEVIALFTSWTCPLINHNFTDFLYKLAHPNKLGCLILH